MEEDFLFILPVLFFDGCFSWYTQKFFFQSPQNFALLYYRRSAGNCILQILKTNCGNICPYLPKKVLVPKFKGAMLSLKKKIFEILAVMRHTYSINSQNTKNVK